MIAEVVASSLAAERSLTPCLAPGRYMLSWASYTCAEDMPIYVDFSPPPQINRLAYEYMAAFRQPLFYSLTVYKRFTGSIEIRPRARLSPWTLPVLAALWSGVMEMEWLWWCWADERHVVCVVDRRGLRYTPRNVLQLVKAVSERSAEL
ncbi:MAG: hypothetical protein QXE68_07045 [Sulfolobales archaeon]